MTREIISPVKYFFLIRIVGYYCNLIEFGEILGLGVTTKQDHREMHFLKIIYGCF